ncbi:MAG: hypothetical protein M3Z85_04995 [Acidobacteriota bacterium]|nr:hypothetical protein [Acidobacteriota bacterium]
MRAGFVLPTAVASIAAAHAQNSVSVRILLGTSDKEPSRWDGSLQAQGAKVDSLEPWRFEGTDAITGSAWRIGTHPVRLFGGGSQVNGQPVRNIVANGVVARLSDASENAILNVTTPQGNFEVRLSEIPYGAGVAKLDGRAFVDRVPSTARLTESPDEEDFPSATAGKDGTVWIAYVMFRHNPEHDRLRARLQTPITDFSKLKAPTGGDQIFARRYVAGKWDAPIAVGESGGDLYRTAIAIDGRGRPWVFWAANVKGNFDIFASPIENGKPGRTVQLSRAAGSDVDAVAATDSNGNVWVAWQGWRNGRAAIFASTQKGDGFSAPAAVAQSAGNEWNPAIAADKSGRVTVAWDSYRAGNYDVYMRTATGPAAWGPEKAVAATARYEAYPSIAYDGSGRLWVAYEEGGRGWGKDFGAYNSEGIAIYQGRLIRICGFETDGRAVDLPADVGTVLPGTPTLHAEKNGAQSATAIDALDPNPDAAKKRVPSRPVANQQNPKNTMPRLLVDASGRMWMAFRSAQPIWWNPLGTVWTEHLVSFDGARWMPPVYLPHTDNLLDNRPALVSTKPGQLMIIGSADGRRQFEIGERRGPTSNDQPAPPQDPYNNDLYANEIVLGPATQITPVAAAKLPAPSAAANSVETVAMRRMRDYRAPSTGLRLVRGEFHRHSSISMDGGFDGSIFDQFRYILDAGSLDWVGCCDHDNGGGREYSWWIIQKLTDIYYSPGKFVPMFNYERSVVYPEGHRNVIFAERGIRTLPRLPISGIDAPGHAPDTQMLYKYLKYFNGVVASHTSGTNMGTDWRDNDPEVEPVVEIYQGDRQNYEMPDASRSNSENDSIGGWRPKGFVNLAFAKGYQLGFEASSDHVSTHMSYCNIFVKDATRESVLDGLKKRHVYGATDNILADVRSGAHMMGDSFSTSSRPSLQVKMMGTSKFAKVHVIKDNNYVYSIEPKSADVSFSWIDSAAVQGKTSYYYVRGEQDNGEIVWVSPMWIAYR